MATAAVLLISPEIKLVATRNNPMASQPRSPKLLRRSAKTSTKPVFHQGSAENKHETHGEHRLVAEA